MKRKSLTRSALFTSIISLLLCVSMLVGTTFAWFTDEVNSGMNNIVAGNLDIELEFSKDASTWNTVSAATDLFSGALWEPGHTEVVYLRLANRGTLALNYQLGINIVNETAGTNVAGASFKLSDFIKFGVVENQNTKFADRAAAVNALTSAKLLNAGYTKANGMNAGDVAYMALVVYMPETVGNEANYLTGTTAPKIELGINVLASQKAYEEDSFGPNYDLLAQGGYVSEAAPEIGETKEFIIQPAGDNVTNEKIGTMNIPGEAVADPEKPIEISIVPTEQDETVVVDADEKALSFDITVSNIKEGNTAKIKVELNVGKGLSGVKVYHKGTEVTNAVYNPNDGYVTFETTSFSPYTVVFDAVYVAPEVEEPTLSNLPKANVTVYTDTANIEWGGFGQFAPTEGLEANLEAAYKFACQDTVEEAQNSPYADWYCDFYVSLDRDLGVNQIFLGGSYGSYGWVGFHNGEVTLAANEELPLLGSVTQNPWTYAAIASFVNEFICGVGDVDDALAGATFTVHLRLTNPANEAEFYNVETIKYTFTQSNKVATAEDLVAALANGGEVKLTADINICETTLTVPTGVSATIDLNGKTINSAPSGNFAFNVNGSNLTLKNGKLISSKYAIGSSGYGDSANVVVLENMVVDAGSVGIYHNGSYYGLDLTIKNSKITGGDLGIFLSGSKSWNAQNELTIENSTIIGSTAVEAKHTAISVTNSTLETNAEEVATRNSTSGNCSVGFAVALTNNTANGNTEVTSGSINLSGNNTITGPIWVKVDSTHEVTTNVTEGIVYGTANDWNK